MNRLLDLFLQHPSVTIDSRDCPKGSLFFALKGDNFNGNKFAKSALENGCSYAIVDEWEEAENAQIILVEDVLSALQELAHDYRQTLSIPIIGITGTNGKTTTKELMANVLSQKYATWCTQGNYNNHIGVPLTLLSIKPEHEIAVIEMGANHPGEIKFLVNIVCPDYGIITNVGKAHLEGFGSLDGVIKTKGELYTYLCNHDGKVFMNLNNAYLQNELGDYPFLSYGLENEKAEVNGEISEAKPFIHLNWQYKNQKHTIETQFIGKYNAENMLAAIRIGLEFGVQPDAINLGLSSYKPCNSRSQYIETKHNKLIVDAYNANPTSMEAAIQNFTDLELNNKIFILGDMLELGSHSDMEHARIIALLQKMKVEDAYLIGDFFYEHNSPFHHFHTVSEARNELLKNPLQNKSILVKGSNGIGLTQLLDIL